MQKMGLGFLIVMLLVLPGMQYGQRAMTPAFEVVPLGVRGGLDESNLSAYLIAPAGTRTYICADAGTVRAGIDLAIRKKTFRGSPEKVLKEYIKGYLLSHPHLDHVAGLVMNSPDDTSKAIYAFPYIINTLKEKYFTWESWANFANEGEQPRLNKYQYHALVPDETAVLTGTGMTVIPYVLSHSAPYESSAFLLQSKGQSLLYLGDTGADTIEHTGRLHALWKAVAPLVVQGQLHAIFIEVSFANEQPDKQLFGHLTPRLLMQEMKVLETLTGKSALQKLPIVITHRKPPARQETNIREQLNRSNDAGLQLVFPVQGQKMIF